jgi:exopolysaccharide production protein ExoY
MAATVQELERLLAQKRSQLRVKRAFDVLVSATLLLALAPAFLVIGVLIRFSSPGAAIFQQARLGRHGREFVLYKFRTMRQATPAWEAAQRAAARQGVLLKSRCDPRLAPGGELLRSTSLDELPQLFNVLRGDMSLVGPRPLVPFMLDPHPEFARARGLVRPGITGLWQVRERENNTSAMAMMAHDLEYIERFRLGLDLGILVKTFATVWSRKGAC